MTNRRSKKKKSGSHGHGSSKKNRGAGHRGGRGNAGRGKKAKHEKMTKDGVHQLGERGFNSRKEDQTGINLRDIDQQIERLVEEGLAEETEDGYKVDLEDLGYEKVLAKGHLTRDIEIHAPKFSSRAEEKIEDGEGTAIKAEE
ncbi:MAG: large subunit ribosomal protein L15 [Colwellia polaris]|jgi:large subunit ribosomal protein L15